MRQGLATLPFAVAAAILLAPLARADCVGSCMINKGCGNAYQSGRVGGYCETMQNDCEAYCRSQASAAYGALAYGERSGKSGWAASYDTAAQARQGALESCGARDCRVVFEFSNSCAALAANGNGSYKVAKGRGAMEAQSLALEYCGRGCDVQVWSCSFPK